MAYRNVYRAALALSLAALPLIAYQSSAEAKLLRRTVVTFASGKKTVDVVSLNTKHDVVANTLTITNKNDQVKTVTTKTTPQKTGGFEVSKTTVGFNGQSHTSSTSVGGKSGHSSHG